MKPATVSGTVTDPWSASAAGGTEALDVPDRLVGGPPHSADEKPPSTAMAAPVT